MVIYSYCIVESFKYYQSNNLGISIVFYEYQLML